ncbi:EF-hand calcium-binding domain-containing protein 14 isoform X3 [Anolis carolinensis]|uniref:EF-hand calcium-binding domain-containing protein 14 isoform X3 n=1 Tax=Anolis carolinensis TaxID=28377 RepID=UPI0004626200|nr:PREDICTED: EF-hand calcium-binding domain-containing protein 14 isoform X2 [Anolis carolinensis]|eukprot:XP_008114566.1 PREDICTED: EF-hand calcium-binding domain-containing protein 14 isoform X2 [Anolis carolinensis]
MKKRKELNALIGLGSERGSGGSGGGGGGSGRKKRHSRKGSASGHRLLRTESAESSSSSSSDPDYGDGFGLPGSRSRFSKSDYLRCCKLCYPLCAFVILAACVVACVGLVWMQVALKEDLDVLKEKFRTMESNQKTSFQEIPRLTEDLLSKQKELDQIKSGDMGLNKIWVNITEINKQISLLMLAVNHLKANIKSASDLINLPVTVEDLQKSVATIGSTVTSVHHDVETMQAAIEVHKKTLETLQNEMSEHMEDVKKKQLSLFTASSVPQTSEKNLTDTCKQDNQYLHTSIEEVNSTLMLYQKLNDLKLFNIDSTISNLTWRVISLENHMMVVNKLEKKENLTLGVVGGLTTSTNVEHEGRNETTTEKVQDIEKTENGESQVSKLREKLQQISSLSRKPENDRSEALKKGKLQSPTSKPTKLPRISSRSVKNSFEGSRHPRGLPLPGISSSEELQDLFRTANQETDGKLPYEDQQKLVGSAIQDSQSFKKSSADRDEKYS